MTLWRAGVYENARKGVAERAYQIVFRLEVSKASKSGARWAVQSTSRILPHVAQREIEVHEIIHSELEILGPKSSSNVQCVLKSSR